MIDRMLNLRPATSADLALLQHWDEQPHIIESDPNDDWGWEIEQSWLMKPSTHLCCSFCSMPSLSAVS